MLHTPAISVSNPDNGMINVSRYQRVIRSRKSKEDMQCNVQKDKEWSTNQHTED
jgi:hypothetical protein